MSERTRIKRLAERAVYDRMTIDAILDDALICHFGLIHDGHPVVIPTIHARVGDTIYVHGSKAAGNLRDLQAGVEVCLTATIVDGIVATRSLFEHSLNYRSVVVFGRSRPVADPAERELALQAISDRILPGRWDDARHPSQAEDRQTAIIAISIEEASAKVRHGFGEDDEADLTLPVWAGVIPIRQVYDEPLAEPGLDPAVPLPEYIRHLVENP